MDEAERLAKKLTRWDDGGTKACQTLMGWEEITSLLREHARRAAEAVIDAGVAAHRAQAQRARDAGLWAYAETHELDAQRIKRLDPDAIIGSLKGGDDAPGDV